MSQAVALQKIIISSIFAETQLSAACANRTLCDQMLEYKVAHFLQKLAEKKQQQFLLKKWRVSKWAKMSPNISATFVRNFVVKNFQKSPNLITLLKGHFLHSSTYTEEDFQRDFGEHEPNDDDVYESDPRQIADFRVVESEERTVEDSADAVCSFDVFGVRKKKSVVWKIQLKDEDPRTVDIDLRPVRSWNKLFFYCSFKNCHFRPIFLHFCLFNTVDSKCSI